MTFKVFVDFKKLEQYLFGKFLSILWSTLTYVRLYARLLNLLLDHCAVNATAHSVWFASTVSRIICDHHSWLLLHTGWWARVVHKKIAETNIKHAGGLPQLPCKLKWLPTSNFSRPTFSKQMTKIILIFFSFSSFSHSHLIMCMSVCVGVSRYFVYLFTFFFRIVKWRTSSPFLHFD